MSMEGHEWEAAMSKAIEPQLSPHPRILFVGHGRSGKDECAKILHNRGPFVASGSLSWFALPYIAKFQRLIEQDAWERRHQFRDQWERYCNNVLRAQDDLFLVKLALGKGNVVTGVRGRAEMDACKSSGLFDAIVWVERPGIPEDPTVKFIREDCNLIIHNDGDLDDLRDTVLAWARLRQWL